MVGRDLAILLALVTLMNDGNHIRCGPYARLSTKTIKITLIPAVFAL